jgi:arsenate reductase (glutaredoxin)
MARGSVIYHNPRCGTSRKTLELLHAFGIEPEVVEYLKTIERPFVVTPKGTRLARPVDTVREIL